MRIAVVGSSGYIGGELVAYLSAEGHDILCLGRSGNFDIYLDLENVEVFDFKQLKTIDCVVFTAAISGPDKCAIEFEQCWKVNVIGTGKFIKVALEHGCRVLFFSSDAVYASRSGEIYDENSVMDPQTEYGRMKQAIEKCFLGWAGFKVVRLSYVVSHRDKFVSYLMRCREQNDIAEIFHPFYRNVIMLDEVLLSVAWLLKYWQQYNPSVLCLSGGELISRLRIVDEINEMCQTQLEYCIVKPNEAFFRNRPRVTQMRSQYLYEYNILPRQTFSERFRQQVGGYIINE